MAKQKEDQLYKKIVIFYDFIFKLVGYNNFIKYIINNKIDASKKHKILDVGCGTGLSTLILKNKFKSAKITCVDNSEEMIAECLSKIKNAEYILGDFNNRKTFVNAKTKKKKQLENNSFDLILSAGAVSEYGDLDKSLPIIFSFLKKDNLFLNIGVRKNFINKLIGNFWGYNARSPDEFILKCKKAGFREVNKIKVPWLMFYLKYRYFVAVARK